MSLGSASTDTDSSGAKRASGGKPAGSHRHVTPRDPSASKVIPFSRAAGIDARRRSTTASGVSSTTQAISDAAQLASASYSARS